MKVSRRHLTGYLKGLPGAGGLRKVLLTCETLAGCLEILEGARAALAAGGPAVPLDSVPMTERELARMSAAS